MNGSLRIGRVAGTEIKVHWTFFLLIVFWGARAANTGGLAAAFSEIAFLLALFTCVVLHEFGHIRAAAHFGVRTPDVILLPIGGVARLERMPDEPRQELIIAIAGPLVTLAIAAGLWAGLLVSGRSPAGPEASFESASFATQLMWVNVFLLVFNLIPAFPMDGGRVLRALLAARLGLPRATRIAARIGQTLALAFGIAGILMGNVIWMLIAAFVFFGASAETRMVETRTAGRGLTVRDMMITRFETIPIYAPLARAVELLLAGDQREFPVVDNEGRVEGVLTRENLIKGLSTRGPDSTVGDAMSPSVPTLEPGLGFEEAMGRLRGSGLPTLPVLEHGRLVGLLSLDNITELILVRRAVER